MCSVIVTCGDIECKYYNPSGCTAPSVDHSTDRFCVTGRRRPRDDIREVMRESEPTGHKVKGRWRNG